MLREQEDICGAVMGGTGLGEEGGPRLSRGMEVETLEYLWNEVTRR